MDNDKNIIDEFWKQNESFIYNMYALENDDKAVAAKIKKALSSVLYAGPSYYYILDFATRKIEYISPSIKDLLGLDPTTITFNDIVSRVHPDDIPFIQLAEAYNLKKIQELGTHLAFKTKLSYCFRELTATGKYELFQLQALSIDVDAEGLTHKVLNIHTNINHLTSINNYHLIITGINDDDLFLQFDLKNQLEANGRKPVFTPREMEIIKLISQGFETGEIAGKLFLSAHTIQTHRKKIMQKAKAKNASQLIHFCLQKGIL